MQSLMNEMAAGGIEAQDYDVGFPFLNATFTYGEATITWNREAAQRFANEAGATPRR